MCPQDGYDVIAVHGTNFAHLPLRGNWRDGQCDHTRARGLILMETEEMFCDWRIRG